MIEHPYPYPHPPKIPKISINLDESYNYQGPYKNGLFHGRGILVLSRNRGVCNGLFKKGNFQSGTLTFKNGSKYSGSFSQNMAEGVGTYSDDNFSLTCIWITGKNDYLEAEIHFKNGDSYQGDLSTKVENIKGIYSKLLPSGLYEEYNLDFQ